MKYYVKLRNINCVFGFIEVDDYDSIYPSSWIKFTALIVNENIDNSESVEVLKEEIMPLSQKEKVYLFKLLTFQ